MKFSNIKKKGKENFINLTGDSLLSTSSASENEIEFYPRGGIDFSDPKFTRTGTGYETCIYIYKYPKDVNECWLSRIMSIDNAKVVLDIATLDKSETLHNLNRSIEEQESRFHSAKTNAEKIEAEDKYFEVQNLYREVSSYSRVMKTILARIYLPAMTKYELDLLVKKTIEELSPDYFSCVCLNETKNDFLNAFIPYSQQQKSIYARKGQPILAETLANGNPFHFDNLDDERGVYLGQTRAGGSIFWDLFHSDNKRMSYNFFAVGMMGAGKSTLLKKIVKDRAMRGDYVRVFDVEGEFIKLCKALGGKVISLDGNSDIKINILEILQSDDEDSSVFSEHISKVKTLWIYLKLEASETELELLEKLLRLLYLEFEIIDEKSNLTRNLNKMKNTDFPRLSDLLRLVKTIQDNPTAYQELIRESMVKILDDIELKLENIVTNHSNVFDCYTSITNIYTEPMIVFDISKLVNLDPSIFDAQLFSAISLVWSNAVSTGKKEKLLYEQGEKGLDDIIHSLLIIDESHISINANKIMGVRALSKMARQGRKYFAGIGLATQRISDYVPDNVNNDAYDELKTLFALTTYRFLMQQDVSDIPKIKDIFRGGITDVEAEKIPTLTRGGCILSIKSYQNIEIAEVHCSNDELSLFSGGR